MKYAFISCTKLKEDFPCKAGEMYLKSTLFSKAVKYVEQQKYDDWFILSAKHGLLDKEDIIDSYNVTLNEMKASERKEWANDVFAKLVKMEKVITEIDFYCGQKYREYLIPLLIRKGIKCNVPLKGKGIGKQLQFYKSVELENQ